MKTNTQAVIILLFLLFLRFSDCPAQPVESKTEIIKSITRSSEIYFKGFVERNPILFTLSHSEECWIMPSTNVAYCGPDAASDFFKKSYEKGLRNGKLILNEIYIQDTIATTEGFYRFIDKDHNILENGIFLMIWKKKGSQWRILRTSFHDQKQ